MPGLLIPIAFTRDLDRSTFCSGVDELDDWLKHHAGQAHDQNNARTTFVVDEKSARIAGYYSLTAFRLELADIEGTRFGRSRRYPVPAVLLGRLAVDRDYQGGGVGKLLLAHALTTLANLAGNVGFEVVVVDAMTQHVVPFYLRSGFEPLTDDGLRLVLSTRDLLRSFASSQL